ncbi:MAG: AAA family ATPase [Proteobacteria bacterium]|nr:AAA family ATPase [Pseudomonadota bacterium]
MPVLRPGGPALRVNTPSVRAAGLLPPEHRARQVSQQYRRIKRPLLANALGQSGAPVPDGHLIMVASAMPGEGKTFTALNLALSIASERDLRVLLVDADVAKPQLSQVLGARDAPGLLDLLRDESRNVEGVVCHTEIPGLSFLPAGAQAVEATELLSSARMRTVCDELSRADRSRLVVFDSPPLLLSTESHALAQVMGQVVVVVRAGTTLREQVQEAVGHVNDRPYVGLVLNQSVVVELGDYGYYYGDAPGGPSP